MHDPQAQWMQGLGMRCRSLLHFSHAAVLLVGRVPRLLIEMVSAAASTSLFDPYHVAGF
jgi:hypothetical protein